MSFRTGRSSAVSRNLFIVLSLLALAWAGLTAPDWTTDDAYISFRYARNLVDGHGLVFNQGERVEGYTNFLWTLWIAAGLKSGFSAEGWSRFWGLLSYLGAILLLLVNHRRLRAEFKEARWLLPLAGLGAAAIADWNIFAASGLETAPFTFLILAGFLIVVRYPERPRVLALAGLVFGLACLIRQDGVLVAFVTGLFVLRHGRPRLRSALAFGASWALIAIPFLIWRVGYYGDLFPNSYYAKSAYLTWYTQGWHYVMLFFERY